MNLPLRLSKSKICNLSFLLYTLKYDCHLFQNIFQCLNITLMLKHIQLYIKLKLVTIFFYCTLELRIIDLVNNINVSDNYQLNANQVLLAGNSLTSSNGCFKLTMQTNGILALRRISDNMVLWISGTSSTVATQTIMQPDGNLVTVPTNNCFS